MIDPSVDGGAAVRLSIVTPMYHSSPYLEEFYQRICAAAERITPDFELVLVNDGSPDRSLELALILHAEDPRVRVIDLSRNFGQHKAMMTGLQHARGELVFLIDCDLEVAPETLERFYERLFEAGSADVVYGIQDTRRDRFFDRWAATSFYTIFNWLTTDPIPRNLVTARLMTRRYVRALVAHDEREMTISGLWALTGFEQIPLVVNKTSKGISSYSLPRRIGVLVNNVTSYSSKPLVWIFYLGCIISSLAAVLAAGLVTWWMFFGGFLSGWLSVFVSIWFLGGINLLGSGLIGIYLSKTFTEAKKRPYTTIRAIHQRDRTEGYAVRADLERGRAVLH